MAIEIAALPMKNGDFPIFMLVYQNVTGYNTMLIVVDNG